MRAVTTAAEPLLLCPQCRLPLPTRPPCACGFVLRETDGILDMMTRAEVEAAQPFLDAYDRVRHAEAWGAEDLDLPFHPKQHHEIWHIRQRTFRTLERIVAPLPRGMAVDAGAGNCWMTRYLDRWGFDAIALDINTSAADGLCAGQKYINEGAVFLRIRAGMERLPFATGKITLLATNAAFHYASDARAALSEFLRVLTPGGKVVIIDSPFYENAADGERMIADRVMDFGQKYGMPEALARRSGYLTFKGFEELLRSMDLRWQFHTVWPGFRRKYEELHARLQGRRLAQFPIVVIESKG